MCLWIYEQYISNILIKQLIRGFDLEEKKDNLEIKFYLTQLRTALMTLQKKV